MEKKCLLIPFFGSLLVFLLTCWTAAFRGPSAEWAESVSFFLFTYCMLERYAKKDTDGIPVVLMIMLGRIILEIPIRIDDFSGTIGSLFVTIVQVRGLTDEEVRSGCREFPGRYDTGTSCCSAR